MFNLTQDYYLKDELPAPHWKFKAIHTNFQAKKPFVILMAMFPDEITLETGT